MGDPTKAPVETASQRLAIRSVAAQSPPPTPPNYKTPANF